MSVESESIKVVVSYLIFVVALVFEFVAPSSLPVNQILTTAGCFVSSPEAEHPELMYLTGGEATDLSVSGQGHGQGQKPGSDTGLLEELCPSLSPYNSLPTYIVYYKCLNIRCFPLEISQFSAVNGT